MTTIRPERWPGKGVLERVDHQFRNNEPEADRGVAIRNTVVDRHANRNLLRVVNHRIGDALAEVGEIGSKFHSLKQLRNLSDIIVLIAGREELLTLSGNGSD